MFDRNNEIVVSATYMFKITNHAYKYSNWNVLNIDFVLQTELPLMLRPFLHDLSNSELHAIMTGGFATIAGSVLAAYISIGVSLV
jgi:nucleoside permease NupC